jgi:hypothetical protein
MNDETSIIARPRDYSNIFQFQDPTVLDAFLNEPLTLVAETITGALAVGKTGAMVAGGRIVQALLKGQAFKQWGKEFHALRDAGKIPDDFAEKKYGFQTWVELMTVIDEESPEAGGPGPGMSSSTKAGCPRCLAFGHLGVHEPQSGFR